MALSIGMGEPPFAPTISCRDWPSMNSIAMKVWSPASAGGRLGFIDGKNGGDVGMV